MFSELGLCSPHQCSRILRWCILIENFLKEEVKLFRYWKWIIVAFFKFALQLITVSLKLLIPVKFHLQSDFQNTCIFPHTHLPQTFFHSWIRAQSNGTGQQQIMSHLSPEPSSTDKYQWACHLEVFVQSGCKCTACCSSRNYLQDIWLHAQPLHVNFPENKTPESIKMYWLVCRRDLSAVCFLAK